VSDIKLYVNHIQNWYRTLTWARWRDEITEF